MEKYIKAGVPLRLMEILSGNHFSTLYKYAQINHILPMESENKRKSRYSIPSVRKIMSHFYSRKHPISKDKKKIAKFHFKGGTGKSSLTVEESVLLALMGYKVLIFDGDQQGHSSNTLGLDYSQRFYTFFDCIKNNISIKDIIIPLFDGLDCIPANLSLADVDEALKDLKEDDRIKVLDNHLKQIEDSYDFIIFDTGPSITDLNRNIFYAADFIDVICNTHPQSMQSLGHIWEYLERFCERHKKRFPEIMITPNIYEDRVSSSLETMTYLKNHWEKYIIPDFAIRKSEDFPRAFLEQTPVAFFCKVNSIAFEDVAEVVRNIVTKCESKIVFNKKEG